MRTIISAVIIDNKKSEHDYSDIYSSRHYRDEEIKFDLLVLDDCTDILKKLSEFRGFDSIITIGNDLDVSPLSNLSFEIRKKWVHFEDFDAEAISSTIIATFIGNIGRSREGSELFSVFTCTFRTKRKDIDRLYASLVKQTYHNWNWWILDDSPEESKVCEYIMGLKDPRIFIIKNISNHGNIGYNKHIIANACDGDYLVEIDHDDEITEDCLRLLKKAFDTFPDVDFVYSYAMEEMDGESISYGDEFALGQGTYERQEVNGEYHVVATTPNITALTLRHIVGLPNHVRCWKRDFYHKIGGHNMELSVLDDMDILIRTYLYGKMCKIPKVLYIQHEGKSSDANGRGSTTQGARYPEILRTGVFLRRRYDKEIHDKIQRDGHDDYIWDEETQSSKIRIMSEPLPMFNYVLTDFD